ELREELRRRRHTPLASMEQQDREDHGIVDDVHRSLEGRRRANSVREAIDRLPESQRAVLYLHRYEEMTFLEIAQALGTTEGAVKLRAFRAYETLRRDLAALVGEEQAA